MNFTTPIILASSSPRRQELMQAAGFNFKVLKPDVEESWPPHMEALEVPEYLARLKAEALKNQAQEAIIVAADTVVLLDQKILGKPIDTHEASSMLLHLSGKTHQVVTGVCLMSTEKMVLFKDTTEVTFKPLTELEIAHYIEQHQPFDKAGAYGIQEWLGMIAVEKIHGCFYNVMGLPIRKVYQALVEW